MSEAILRRIDAGRTRHIWKQLLDSYYYRSYCGLTRLECHLTPLDDAPVCRKCERIMDRMVARGGA